MKKVVVSLTVMLALTCVWQLGFLSVQSEVLAEVQSKGPGTAGDQVPVSSSMVMQNMNLQPLAFTENQGQWDERVLFRANAGGATMWFAKDGAYYQFTRQVGQDPRISPEFPKGDPDAVGGRRPRLPHDIIQGTGRSGDLPRTGVGHDLLGRDDEQSEYESIMIKASFVGANPDPQMVGVEEMEYKCNYFIGNDPNEWHTDVPNYEYVLYEDVYPGIDLKYYGNGRQMEYDFIVSPGANPSQIAIEYEGAKSVLINEAGQLVVETDWGEVIEERPIVYQHDGNRRVVLDCEYDLLSERTFGFRFSKSYDPDLTLIVDPVLEYSTYLGGGSTDCGYGIAVDGSGNAYVTGWTQSSNFPTENPYQTDQDSRDIFVTKLSSTGNSLIYSTYLGGNDHDYGRGIALDASGCAYVTGQTYSYDFPTENPYQTNQGAADVFVTKLSSSGNSLIYSTYLGGGGYEEGWGIAVDGSGNAYVTGGTHSSDFPTENPYQATHQGGDNDAFVTKLSSSGSSLIYSTYLGGGSNDYGYGIAVDGSGNAYVTGYTWSSDFPTENPYQTNQPGGDAFVTRLSSSGNSLIYSTYLGGGEYEEAWDVAVDGSENAFVTGHTHSTDFPTENPFQVNHGGGVYDVFVTKLSSLGNSLVYSTYLGGGGVDYCYGIAIDVNGNAYVTGKTESSDFPTENPYQTDQGDDDVFVTKLSSSGSSLIFSTYLGGGNDDKGRAIAVDNTAGTYVTGYTASSDFPIENPYQMDQSFDDAFVTKFYAESPYICGDADGNTIVEISDAVHLISYVFVPGSPAPDPLAAGDADCNTIVEISDAVLLISYVFVPGSPEPCDPDGDGEPDC